MTVANHQTMMMVRLLVAFLVLSFAAAPASAGLKAPKKKPSKTLKQKVKDKIRQRNIGRLMKKKPASSKTNTAARLTFRTVLRRARFGRIANRLKKLQKSPEVQSLASFISAHGPKRSNGVIIKHLKGQSIYDVVYMDGRGRVFLGTKHPQSTGAMLIEKQGPFGAPIAAEALEKENVTYQSIAASIRSVSGQLAKGKRVEVVQLSSFDR
jgi:hypothetical protein